MIKTFKCAVRRLLRKIKSVLINETVIDVQDYTDPNNHLNLKMYVDKQGNLLFQSKIDAGEIVGVISYTDYEKKILQLPTQHTCLDFIYKPLETTE